MKNRFCIFLIFISVFLLGLASCKSEVEGKNLQGKNKVTIDIHFSSFEEKLFSNSIEKAARKAYLEKDDVISSYLYTLKGTYKGTERTLFEKKKYDDLFSYDMELEAGVWDFTLAAVIVDGEDENEKITAFLSDSIEQMNIDGGEILEFTLSYIENVKGNYTILIPLSDTVSPEEYTNHQIKIVNYNNPSQTVFAYNGTETQQSEEPVVTQPELQEIDYEMTCSYVLTLPVGKYIIFLYSPDDADMKQPYATDFINIYGGLNYSKTYPYSAYEEVRQDLRVELYADYDYENVSYVDAEDCTYFYDSTKNCFVYEVNSARTDIYLPKEMCAQGKYLTGWYTDSELTQMADYSYYTYCPDDARILENTRYFIYDIGNIAGVLKLYASLADTYTVNIYVRDEDGNDAELYSNDGITIPDPQDGVYVFEDCSYEFVMKKLSPEKQGCVFVGWYLDEDHTEPLTRPYLNTSLDADVINLYPLFIDSDATMSIKYMDGNEELSVDNLPESIEASEASEYNQQIQISLYTEPEKNGYIFKGWYLDEEFENPLTCDGYYYHYKINLKDFVPGGEIIFYAEFEKKFNVTINNFTQNNLKLTPELRSDNDGTFLYVTAAPVDESIQKEYESYSWYVNGILIENNNGDSLNYIICQNLQDGMINNYTDSSILISCIAKINDVDYDDASVDLQIDLATNIEVDFPVYETDILKMTCEVEDNQGEYTYMFTVSSKSEGVDLDDDTISYIWYLDGTYKFSDDSQHEALTTSYELSSGYATLSTGNHVITCIIAVPDGGSFLTYDVSYYFTKE